MPDMNQHDRSEKHNSVYKSMDDLPITFGPTELSSIFGIKLLFFILILRIQAVPPHAAAVADGAS